MAPFHLSLSLFLNGCPSSCHYSYPHSLVSLATCISSTKERTRTDSEELGPRAPLSPLLVLWIWLAGHSDGAWGFAELKQSQFCLTFHSSKQSAKFWGKQVQTFNSQVTQVPQSIGFDKGEEMESAAKQMTLCVREITVPKRMSNPAFQAEWATIYPPHWAP